MLNFTFVTNIFADTNFRVMTYNALFFPSEDGAGRLDDFRAVFEEIQPDILLMQEIESSAGADMLLVELNSSGTEYTRAAFFSGYGSIYSMLFYKIAIADLTSQDVIDTPRRDIYEYVMTIDGNPIRFYSCHLKASEDCELERFEEVSILRDYLNLLPEGTEFIIVGDMNFYTSTETGYLKFIADEANNIGRAEDLCDEVGNWHNNITYSSVHSQSSRYEKFGGGASGGLDDKFDFIFGNYGINNGSGVEYNSESFTVYGNDGAHFDQSVNDGTNSAVPDSVADALYYASDHLPVYADFTSLESENILTIYDIQFTTEPSGNSPFAGDTITISGIVTASKNNYCYFLQDDVGAWNGIFVYDLPHNPNRGDSLTISGLVNEYYKKTELKNIANYTVNSTGNDLPEAVLIATSEVAQEKYEGVLISVSNAECVNTDLGYGEWLVNDGSGSVRIDDEMFPFSPILNAIYEITGVVDYSWYNFKIEPRDADDIQLPVPKNVTIYVYSDSVHIQWDAISGATSYNVYSSSEPYSGFSQDTTGTLIDTTWTAHIPNVKKFYYITAE